ncbi:MAG: C45 family autoproteolytic acyltransferase/hydrolase [Myxococcota bacterium]
MADLVIGARRPYHHQRTLRGTAVAGALLLACVLAGYFVYERVVSYVEPELSDSDGELELLAMQDGAGEQDRGDAVRLAAHGASLGVTGTSAVLRAAGSPQQLGAAHGRLLGGALGPPTEALQVTVTHAVPRGGWLGRLSHGLRLRCHLRRLDDVMPCHQLVEMAAAVRGTTAAEGTGPEYETFVRSQAALDVGEPAPWSSGATLRAVTRSLSFVSELRGTSGDRLLVGRTFALPGAGDGGDAAAEHQLVSFVRADTVIPFASVGWPGLTGVVSGINAEGIAIMVHPVRTAGVSLSRQAQPIALLARDVLENARSLDDAIAILEHGAPLGAAAYLVVDGEARRWAVVERSPTEVAVMRDARPAVVGDVLTAENFEQDPDNDRARRVRPATMRRQRAARLLGGRLDDPAAFAAVLRDRRDPDGAPLPPGHRGAVYDAAAVHTALFDASAMVLWVADHADPEARFRAFDLRYELRGEGNRPAPPGDIAAAAQLDEGLATRLRRARRLLRLARAERDRHQLSRAREWVQRALAHAPTLPEAQHLAGELAALAGQRARAMEHYRRYLELGPDDLGAAEEVRAVLGN